MKEVRPGIIMVRRTKRNKLQELKNGVTIEKSKIEAEIAEKYAKGEKAVYDLQDFARSVTGYVDALKDRGIDVDFIKENAEQIRTIFFAVLELIENGNKGFDDSLEDEKAEDTQAAAEEERLFDNSSSDGIYGRDFRSRSIPGGIGW